MKIDHLAVELRAILDEMDITNAKLKGLRQRKDSILHQVQGLMEEVGIDSAKSNDAGLSLSIKEELVADYDPEKFEGIFKWCSEQNRYDFIQRRMSSAKIREYVESGGGLPEGLTLSPITKVMFRRS
tara:strand:+ start:365 stop:745 length:381 start_codon:yes stop_codon:yes gene_type:complete